MRFKNNYIQENEAENKEKRWGENGEFHHKIELYIKKVSKILALKNTVTEINLIDGFNIGLDTTKKEDL